MVKWIEILSDHCDNIARKNSIRNYWSCNEITVTCTAHPNGRWKKNSLPNFFIHFLLWLCLLYRIPLLYNIPYKKCECDVTPTDSFNAFISENFTQTDHFSRGWPNCSQWRHQCCQTFRLLCVTVHTTYTMNKFTKNRLNGWNIVEKSFSVEEKLIAEHYVTLGEVYICSALCVIYSTRTTKSFCNTFI